MQEELIKIMMMECAIVYNDNIDTMITIEDITNDVYDRYIKKN